MGAVSIYGYRPATPPSSDLPKELSARDRHSHAPRWAGDYLFEVGKGRDFLLTDERGVRLGDGRLKIIRFAPHLVP